MAFRASLLKEILFLSLDTLRANKLRSALTILGVVIGVSSVVGMTSLIRGFGDQMTGLVQQMGASTVYVAKLSIASLFSGKNFFDLLKRPDITEEDAKAIKELCPSVDLVGIQLGGGPAQQPSRFTYRDKSTKAMQVIGSTANFPETNYLEIVAGRFFSDYEVSHRRQVVVLGHAPAEALFPNLDPIGKKVRIGSDEYTVIGTVGKRPSPLGGNQPNEFAVIPITTYDKKYDTPRIRGMLVRFVMLAIVPHQGVSREQMIKEVEEVMRTRHHLRLDQENDFDILTSDMILKIFDQITQAVVLALVVISSIALMVCPGADRPWCAGWRRRCDREGCW
jgi:putative ABC transport system permease protein